ncbi:MAG: DUF192 domain-containing protein [Candidatus Shapirobacteria bacterium]|jgi:hypothetical protein
MPKYLSIVAILILFGFLVYKILSKDSPKGVVTLAINNQNFDLEIAKSMGQKSAGLSGRPSLCKNCGMIFVYSTDGIYPFWMKDTLIPLDMIWISKDGVITDIFTAHPQPDTPITRLTLYQNTTPARYIIELNAGISTQIGLKPGNRIWIDPPTFP